MKLFLCIFSVSRASFLGPYISRPPSSQTSSAYIIFLNSVDQVSRSYTTTGTITDFIC